MDRDSIVVRYRHLREILAAHKDAALAHLSEQTVLDQARFLRVAAGKTILASSDEERTLVIDLAMHAPRHARSRTFERYRKAAKPAPGSDEARVLDALCAARFVIGSIERRHDVAGLVATDLLRDTELWLMDVSLEATFCDRFSFAGYLITLDGFWMTTGVLAPVERDDLASALDHLPPARGGAPEAVADDPLFAGLVCRAALARGAMDQIMMAQPEELGL
jgi:hypothetical protein